MKPTLDIRTMRYDVFREDAGPRINSCDAPNRDNWDLDQLEAQWNAKTDDEIIDELMRRWVSGEAPTP